MRIDPIDMYYLFAPNYLLENAKDYAVLVTTQAVYNYRYSDI
jgi:hypothetical protein